MSQHPKSASDGRMSKAATQLLVQSVQSQGFAVLEGAIGSADCAGLRRDIDSAITAGNRKATGGAGVPSQHHHLGAVTACPPVMQVLSELMPGGFAMQHLQCDRHDTGEPGAAWHSDHTHSVTPRPGMLVYAFMYPAGLDGTIGDLVVRYLLSPALDLAYSEQLVMPQQVLPGSQKLWPMDRLSLAPLFDTADLPGSITLSRLEPGSVVLLHGGIFHARRQQPGGTARYFVDVCYMEAVGSAGRRWPAYRYDSGGLQVMAQVNAHAKRAAAKHWPLQGDGGGAESAEYEQLYDLSCFFDRTTATQHEQCERDQEAAVEAAGAAREQKLRSAKL